jgi:hypothetical protein
MERKLRSFIDQSNAIPQGGCSPTLLITTRATGQALPKAGNALGTLKKIILSPEVAISAAATELENLSDLKVTTEQSLQTTGLLLV